jgi:Holliday junction resolvase RusA-like endonuclease
VTTIRIEGIPFAKQRPRRGRGGHFYTPAETREAEAEVAEALGQKWLGDPHTCPVSCRMEFHLPARMAYGTPRARRAKDDTSPARREVRGDWDNYAKLLSDAATGVVWENDRQVEVCHVALSFDDANCTVLTVHPPDPGELP